MPAMAPGESLFCRSAPWAAFARRAVVPWAVRPDALRGTVLEIGAGSGAMAAAVLDRAPAVRLVATDVDPAMVAAAARRLARHGGRASAEVADATRLPYAAGSFDAVLSFLMLHHTLDVPAVLAEVARVLRPGGTFAGYDLLDTAVTRAIHAADRSPHRLAGLATLRDELGRLPFAEVRTRVSFAGTVARFRARLG